MNILTGIVTYNPNISRLKENISSVIDQTDKILVVDNNSSNIDEIKILCDNFADKVQLKMYKQNEGIAKALKFIMTYASIQHYDWVLTLDQDSVVIGNLIQHYKKYISISVGAMTCFVKDRNIVRNQKCEENVIDVDTCLTSGCFMNVTAYNTTSGYDPRFFIDCVDFDICYLLKENGYKIIRIPYVGLLHEIGKGKNICFLGRKTQTFNHPAWRRYYANRNMIFLAKKHPQFVSMNLAIGRCLYRTIVVLIFENDKKNKLVENIRGIKDGIKQHI